MKLSDRFKVEETTYNINLYEYRTGIKPVTREEVSNWALVGHYPCTAKGRSYVYHKIINLLISGQEEQDLKKILEIVEKTSKEIVDFFDKQ